MEQRYERVLKDSGNRTEFESGAVRDVQEGKGRCDLLPLDVVAAMIPPHERQHCVIACIEKFTDMGDVAHLYGALQWFRELRRWDLPSTLLEVSVHFEDGAKKYGDNNWRKGIPVRCYINSGIRHYLKWVRGDNDEPHDRAFCWNIMCAIWTCKHKPELNEYAKEAQNAD